MKEFDEEKDAQQARDYHFERFDLIRSSSALKYYEKLHF